MLLAKGKDLRQTPVCLDLFSERYSMFYRLQYLESLQQISDIRVYSQII